jgi:glycine amidinotransferase
MNTAIESDLLEEMIVPNISTKSVISKPSIVNSYNEWDPLEEVIVGNIDGAAIPPWHIMLQATMPLQHTQMYQQQGGQPYPKELIDAARKDLDEFVHLLEAEGVTVRRPDIVDYAKPFATPDWNSQGGLYSAMPRDLLLIIGNEIIEAPMPWRSRYFEINAYRKLLKHYFSLGARWTALPKPQLSDEIYDYTYQEEQVGKAVRYVITEFEPVFDAADFVRCGKDIFYQKSNVTNAFGVEWLRRHLGDNYRLHEIKPNDSHPMHIDATFMPLAPGKVLINPERFDKLPEVLKNWEALKAPASCIPENFDLFMSSRWLSMNILMLDQERVIVEKGETALIKSFKDWGFKPIICNFRNFNRFGGSFHCATADIRRKGSLQSYL